VHRPRALLPVGIASRRRELRRILGAAPDPESRSSRSAAFRWRSIETLSAKMRIFRAPEFLGTAFLLAVLAHARQPDARKLGAMAGVPLYAQLINLLAALLLLLAFAMLTQRRVLSLVNLFAAQGLRSRVSTAIVAFAHAPAASVLRRRR
jgi:hypothetical protein